MRQEETIDFHIRWAWAKMSKAYNAEAQKHGGSMAIGYALLSIDRDGTPSTGLGPKMGMEPTGMSRLLNSMEEEGLIERRPDPHDGRRVNVFLTKKGKAHRDLSKKIVLDFNENMRKRLGQKKMSAFFEVMQALNEELDKNNLFE